MRSELIAVSLSPLSPVMRWHIGDIRSRRQVTSDRRLAPPVSYCGMLGGDNIWPQIILWTEELKLRCVDINLQHRGCFCVWDTSWHHDKTETKINRRLTSNWLMIEIILLSNCQALVPSPVPLDPNPKQSKIQIQVQLRLGWHNNHIGHRAGGTDLNIWITLARHCNRDAMNLVPS